jgi:release factor glutamine methyltransferase
MANRVGHILRESARRLHPVSGDLSQREAELILENVLNTTRAALYTDNSIAVETKQSELIENIVEKRLAGKPLAHILGSVYFHSKKFTITGDVLIPRPDTETLIEEVLQTETKNPRLFLDMGTGSGNIAETLCMLRPEWKAVATDLSEAALRVARSNCCASVNLLCSDKLCALKEQALFDFIVSNPPYISAEEIKTLDPAVVDHEPSLALYGGEDGLDYYHYLANNSKKFLKRGGHIYCEIGFSQASACRKLFHNAHWKDIKISPDLAARPRVISCRL